MIPSTPRKGASEAFTVAFETARSRVRRLRDGYPAGNSPRRSNGILVTLGYLWAAPNTLLGIAIGLLLGGRFEWVDGVIEVHGRHVSRALGNMILPARAMTIGHVVLGCDREALAVTRLHERVHVRQYAIWGPFFLPAYLGISLWLYARRRDGYRENPFEIQAYDVDDPARPKPRANPGAPPEPGGHS